jgi:hypothetical protein
MEHTFIALARKRPGTQIRRHRGATASQILSAFLALSLLSAFAPALKANAGGSISGTVLDPGGAVVAGAKITATEASSGVRRATLTDVKGFYSFPALRVGRYDLEIDAAGFGAYKRSAIMVDTDSAVRVDATLAVGPVQEMVTVSGEGIHIDAADTQMGEVISGAKITGLPLLGRSYTDLLALQPGVIPITSTTSASIADVGASTFSPSGDLNPGTISISGQREVANGFDVNGADVEERINMGAAIIPNLDSIAEFRILTSNVDAQYGNYNGGQVIVVTKSGTNQFHGDAFEFLRNTALDARNFFSPTRGTFSQNQFGGTAGGPIIRNKVLFFADFQHTGTKQGIDTGLIQVPSLADRTGNLADLASQLTGVVGSGPNWPGMLSRELGYPVVAGEPYYSPGCSTTAQCVFPNAVIPQSVWSAPSRHLLQYIPAPNLGGSTFSTSALNQSLRDDKGGLRMDASTRLGLISAYYFADDFSLNNPYPTAQSGANVPGFNAMSLGRSQMINLGDVKTFGATAINEFHLTYVRDANQLGNPVGGVGTSLASQGFVTGAGTPGIVPLAPSIEGVENVFFNNYTIGETSTGLAQVNNSYEVSDNFSKVTGTHTIKLGGEIVSTQINAAPNVQSNGSFSFFGTETGVDFADFLLGIASTYTQGAAQSFYNRDWYAGAFVQDSWRAKPRLTVNYGLRWDLIMPWYEKYNQVQTLVPGEQSVVFPGAPAGLVFPGDPGIPNTLAPSRWNDFSPRLGIAYAPGPHDGLLGWLLGGDDKTSIRAGFGRFFSAIEGTTAGVMAANAPYGTTYTSPSQPLFATPFISASGVNEGQRFPLPFAPLNSSASNPDPNINWAQFEPITGVPGYLPTNKSPYSLQYNVSIQRQFGLNTLLTISYVGSEAHHLLVLVQANPGNPSLCLSLSQPGEVAPGSATCGPFGEGGVYTTAAGHVINGTRGPFGAAFGSNTYQAAVGNSNYNALEITLHHSGRRLELLAGYTYGKSLDNSSSLAEQVNPLNYRLTYAPSSFDMEHNFVISYKYELPFDALFHASNRLTAGWFISGITRFSTGLPVTLFNNSDNSLLGTAPDGVNNFSVDLPNVTSGPLNLNHNPRNGQPYFNTSLFSLPALGESGNSARRIFFGPGIDNFDMALLKSVRVTESKTLELRLEAFNVFNHAQFYGPSSVDGVIDSPQFGRVVSAAAPRLMQAGMKFTF